MSGECRYPPISEHYSDPNSEAAKAQLIVFYLYGNLDAITIQIVFVLPSPQGQYLVLKVSI